MSESTTPSRVYSLLGEKPVPQETVLIVEDEAILAMDLKRKISLMGYIVAGPLATGEEAIAFVSKNRVDLVLMDIELAGKITGITAAETIVQTTDVPIVFLTGFSHDLLIEQSKLAAPYGYLIKPAPEQEVAATLKMVLNRHMLDRQLQESRIALEKSAAKYRHLFENSPLGIFRTSLEGKVLAVNAQMANILGCGTSEEAVSDFTDLGKQFYVAPKRRQEFITQLQENGAVDNFEYEGRKRSGGKIWVSMNARLTPADEVNGHGSEQVIDGFAMDITERKLARTYRELGIEVLQILNEPGELRETIQRVLDALKRGTGCYAAGVRLQDGEDYPYFAQVGFSADFILTENSLVEHPADNSICRDKDGGVKLACTCGLVISGKIDPALPFFTPGGSFWINDSQPLLDIPSSEDPRYNPRNQCIHRGYNSFALIPVRNKRKIFGLIQLNDRRKGCFTRGTIEFLEEIATHIGEAISRKKIEERVRDSEEQHRVLVSNLPDVVMRFDREGKHLFVSENVSEVFVLPAKQFIGKNHHELGFPENVCSFLSKSIQGVFENGLPFESEISFDSKEGSVIHNWRFVPEMNAQGQVISALSLSRDITEQRQAQQNYKILFHEMLEGFALHEIICNKAGNPIDYRFLSVNPAFERMTGLRAADIIGRTVLEVLPNTEQYWLEAYGRVALTGEQFHFEHYSSELRKHFEVSAFQPASNKFACIFMDVTERKRAEEENKLLQTQLLQAQKMEAIGTLAGGIAHDFNNILGAILGYAEMVQEDSPVGSKNRGDIEQVLKASYRAKELVKQILTFSRQAETEQIPLQPAVIIKEAVKLLRSSLPSTITLQQDVDPDVGLILADPTQIHQVLMNLCTNAFHAMEKTGGTLQITLKDCELSPQDLQLNPNLQPGRYVALSIGDTGPGIGPEIRDRIFEPYFTTKEVGKGTGMGLAIAHGIITSFGGFITCESQPGQGAIFHVLFPAIEQEFFPDNKPIEAAPPGKERILLIDDEEMLVGLGKAVLEQYGYEVTVQTNSREALALFQNNPGLFDVVITDQTMPGMTGIQLAQCMLQLRPDLPIILCTGYSTLINEEQVKAQGVKGFIMKPYAINEIATLLREVLDVK